MNNRGSEWRRWDLHLHTPGTKKQDHYNGLTDEDKWNRFYDTISNYVGDGTDPLRAVCAIAITDYVVIDNYFKVIEDQKVGRIPDCIKLIIPNVELRMTPIAKNSPINIHCLFDPSIALELESRFFAKLSFIYNGLPFGATKTDLVRLGRAFRNDESLPEEVAYRIGIDQFVVSFDAINNIFTTDKKLREKTIIVVSNKSTDGVSGITAHSDYFIGNISQLEATRRSIYQLADMVFSSSQKDIDYFLGKGPDSIEIVRTKCKTLKPCIHGSDAHCNERIFAPEDDRFCWIKAEPTFEGLRQAIFEPSRVKIQHDAPERKRDYQVIDSVVLNHTDFSEQHIPLNPGLNAIIGGRSSGKSLMLGCIARNAGSTVEIKANKPEYNQFVRSIAKRSSIIWRDGAINEERPIDYFPQGYIIGITTDVEKRVELVEHLIKQDPLRSTMLQDLHTELTILTGTIHQEFADLLVYHNTKKQLQAEFKKHGSKSGIEQEIQKLQGLFERLKESMPKQLTEDEEKKYILQKDTLEQLNKSIAKNNKAISNLKNDDILGYFNTFALSDVIQDPQLASRVKAEFEAVLSIARDEWTRRITAIIRELQLINEDAEAKRQEILQDALYITAEDFFSQNEELLSVSKALTEERKRLDDISIIEGKIAENQIEILSSFERLVHNHLQFLLKSKQFCESIALERDGVRITAHIVFSDLQYSTFADEYFDGRYSGNDSVIRLKYTDDEEYRKSIRSILHNLSANQYSLKKGANSSFVAEKLLSTNWFRVEYDIQYQGDTLQSMSEGKAAYVILRLLLDFSENECPILIDQPEDELDNRAIFTELVTYIREKKKKRQIILVTHNPNIVVGADAEEVIVANHHGVGNKNHNNVKFEYVTGPLENSFKAPTSPYILSQKGIREHVCEILEGGVEAFQKREERYRL